MNKRNCFTLQTLAELTDSKLIGDPNYEICGFAELEKATKEDISFLSSPKYIDTRYVKAMLASKAGAIFVAPHVDLPEKRNFLINKDPSFAFQQSLELIHGETYLLSGFEGIHKSAVIHETCQLAENVTIGPNVVIDKDVMIGSNTFIGAGSYIGPNCTICDNCEINPNVTIRKDCQIGNNVIIQPGAVIGGCGFGFATNESGSHQRLKHIGRIIIEDDVEIGSNTTIDRARFGTTIIGKGTKIDNLVAIGHNVRIGQKNIICGQTGIAGSTQTGNNVVMAGQVGVNGHIKICDNVIVAGKSGITKSIDKPGRYSGNPIQTLENYNRNNVYLKNIDSYVKEIKELKSKMADSV